MSGKSKFVLVLSILVLLLFAVTIIGSTYIGLPASVAELLYIIAGVLLWVIILVMLGSRFWKLLYLIFVMELAIGAIICVVLGDYLSAIVGAVLTVLLFPTMFRWVFKRI